VTSSASRQKKTGLTDRQQQPRIKPILKTYSANIGNENQQQAGRLTAHEQQLKANISNLLYQKSKSAENLNNQADSSRSRLEKKRSFNSLTPGQTSTGTNQRRAFSVEKKLASSNDDLKLLKEFELIESFFNKNRNTKSAEKRSMFARLFGFLFDTNQNVRNRSLEVKFDQMKRELSELKEQLNLHSSSSLTKPVAEEQTPVKSDGQFISISTDLNNGLERIVANYSSNLTEMQRQLNDLSRFNKNVTKKSDQKPGEEKIMKNSTPKKFLFNSKLDYTERLERECKELSERCRCLQLQLDDKTKQTDQYIQLFKLMLNFGF
jgi:hypothetical protein